MTEFGAASRSSGGHTSDPYAEISQVAPGAVGEAAA